jgi:hypothetical protein
MKIITKIDEFLATKTANQPATKPGQPAPTIKPGTSPSKTPSRPSPIRRDKPSVEPAPKAKVADVMKRFMEELRKNKTPMEFNLGKLKERYDD